MSRLPRCKFCKDKIIWAKEWDGRMIPVALGDGDLLLTPSGEGLKATRPTEIEALRARGHVTGRQHRCPPKEAKS